MEQAFNASNICAVLDVPFALFFVFVLYLLEPTIALVVLAFLVIVFLEASGEQRPPQKNSDLTSASGASSALIGTAVREAETVRANAGTFLRSAWGEHSSLVHGLRRLVGMRQGLVQSNGQSANAILSVVVIVIAGILVVQGDLDVGSMIGINILAAARCSQSRGFRNWAPVLQRANQSRDVRGVFEDAA